MFRVLRRFSSTLPREAKALVYEKNGSALDVLKLVTQPLPGTLSDEQVLVEFLASPINPADLNMIEGVYPIGPAVPAVGGNEGVARVLSVGRSVHSLKVGDWVIPSRPGLGTWRSHAVVTAADVDAVPSDIEPEYAACLAVNPSTAVRLLDDFVELRKGDVLIQNGGNSAVGQAVAQLAKERGVQVVSVIRDRVDWPDTVERMKAYGAFMVLKESELGSAATKKLFADLPAPRLALNCVGGSSATEMARLLAKGGTMVTYGGMSRKPVQVPTSVLIFKDIKLQGFWLSRWVEQHSKEERMAMLNPLFEKVREKKLRMWIEKYKLHTEWNTAFERSAVQRNRKPILVFK